MNQIEDLMRMLEVDFQKRLLSAAERSLQDNENPVRLNNFCTNFRELVRHVLDYLAPNEEIKACTWYIPDSTSTTGVTRSHRAAFLIHGGISVEYASTQLMIDIEGERRGFTKAVSELSKYTHVNPTTFDTPADKVEEHVARACGALRTLLLVAASARKKLIEAIQERIEEEVVHAVLRETVMAVDEIASHHSIEGVALDNVEVLRIGADEIEFIAFGSLEVELQWGSNSDRRKGDGATLNQTFPLTLKLTAPVDEPSLIEAIDDSLSVDISDWYDATSDRDDEAAYWEGKGGL